MSENVQKLPAGFAIVPTTPTKAMLAPFLHCPLDELDLAYSAMLQIAAVQIARGIAK